MPNLLIFDELNSWKKLTVANGEIKIDYKTIEQETEIMQVYKKMYDLQLESAKRHNIFLDPKSDDFNKNVVELLTVDEELNIKLKSFEKTIKRLHIQYCLKDWKGFTSNGKDIKLNLLPHFNGGTKVDDNIMNAIMNIEPLSNEIFDIILESVAVPEEYKKK